MAAFAKSATLASTADAPPAACGTYTLEAEQGKSGGKTYYCPTTRLYLYERSPGAWCVGKKSGGKSCKAYDAKGWHFYEDHKWTKRADVALTFGAHSTPSEEVEALCVECRYANLSGGYRRTEREEGAKPVFRNEEKEKELWFSPDGAWLFSDAAGVDAAGDYDAFLESKEDNAESPELADWSDQHVHVHPVDLEAIKALHAFLDQEDDLFRDPEFVPSAEILDKAHGDASWIRAARLSGPHEEPQLWDGVEPSDIMQGALGDCWLLCALSAVAEFPGFVENTLFETKEVSPDGKYALRLYDASLKKFVSVEVDDRVPCNTATWWEAPRPLFSQPHGNEMYILLIEKAFAKLAGGYGRLQGGYPVLAWLTLTGCEDLSIWHAKESHWEESVVALNEVRKDPHDYQALYTQASDVTKSAVDMFSYLLHCDEANYVFAGSINKGSEVEKQRDDGLVERHAYSIIRVCRVTSVPGLVGLVQARNPWGNNFEWNGAWSDRSELWEKHPQVGAEIGRKYLSADDGLFWMAWADFSAVFDTVQVCARRMDAPRGTHRSGATPGNTPVTSPVKQRGSVRSETAVEAAPPMDDAPSPLDAPRTGHHAMDLPPPPTMDEAPDTPPSDWQPTRLGISYRPCRLAVEYVSAGKAFRKLMPVARSSSDATPEGVLSGLENDFGAYLDFDEKLSRSQALRLVEMLLASAA